MPSLPQNLQSLTPEAQIELFVLTDYKLTPSGGGGYGSGGSSGGADVLPDAFRFCNFTGVRWRETPGSPPYNYQAIGCESEGYDVTGQGALPQPKVVVSNVGRIVSDLLFQLKNNPLYRLEGATLIRHVTQVNFLEDGPDYLEPARQLPPQIYQIEQVDNETISAVQFVLSSSFDLDGATFPNRQALRTCPYRYRGPECGYTGSAMFTRANQPTGDATQDICNKSLTACELRFPVGLLPFGGYPGLGGF